MTKKHFRLAKTNHCDTVEKEVVDEIIFRTTKTRNRLILELTARGGMMMKPDDTNPRCSLVFRYAQCPMLRFQGDLV
jgi:hypothetical protein